ncbi:MAG: hypothetical protein J0H49_37390 [Acidobacteria bacterium]|nr:hypothetical protein [Acidobacteriota bacterium]
MTEHLHTDSGRNGEVSGSNSAMGRWTMPDSGAVFTIDAGLIQKLRSFVLEGFHILPKRGAEMGGILLGRILSESPLSIEITGFEPVPCEYRYGPSYILSDTDRAKLEQALANNPALPTPGGVQETPAPVVVGCFRSCTGRELALDAADQQLMRKYFPDPRHVILSIRPISIFECEAWFFCRINGVLPRVPSQSPEPFGQPLGKSGRTADRASRPELSAVPTAEPEAQAPVPEMAAAPAAAVQEPVAMEPPPVPVAVPVERALAATAGASPAALAPASPAATASAAPVEAPASDTRTSELPHPVRPMSEDLPGSDEAWRLVERRRMLREQRSEPGTPGVEEPPVAAAPMEPLVEPRWLLNDHAAEPHKHRLWQLIAALLVLLVSGGAGYQWWDAQQRARWSRLGLDAKPAAGGIEISWDRESPALKDASRGELEVADAGDGKTGDPGRVRSVELDAQTLHAGSYLYPTSSTDLLFRLQLYSTGLASAVESVRVVGAGGKVEAKELAAKPAAPPAAPASGASAPSAPALKPVAVAANATPAPGPSAGSTTGTASTPAALPAIPAAPIYEMQPTVPEGVRARIRTPITVPVQVNVDAQGRVSGSAAKGDGDGVYRFLAERAAVAAQSWKFRPARSAGGAAMPSTQVVYFTFRN